jgi:hypothetical protein
MGGVRYKDSKYLITAVIIAAQMKRKSLLRI